MKIHAYNDCGKETVVTIPVFPLYKIEKYKSIEGETIKDLS